MRKALFALLLAFLQICLLRRRPQDIPASRELLYLSLLTYTLASIGLAAGAQSIDAATLAGVAETLVLAALVYALLYFRGLAQRWPQTMTALAGAGTIFSVLSVPLFLALSPGTDALPGRTAIYLLIIVLLIWNVAVVAHILRHALSTSYGTGLIFALALIWLIAVALAPLLQEQAFS